MQKGGNSGVINTSEPCKLIVVSFICYNILYHDITNKLCSTGKKLMDELRLQAKKFYSTINNRVNFDAFVKQHPKLLSNSLLRDLNETRISSRHNLIRSSLQLKSTLTMYFGAYQL